MASAAFGRLCVETGYDPIENTDSLPAAFGRLCVETGTAYIYSPNYEPAAFGRLCVETGVFLYHQGRTASRLRAAVC